MTETQLANLSTEELIHYVDRSNPEVKELCLRIERLQVLFRGAPKQVPVEDIVEELF